MRTGVALGCCLLAGLASSSLAQAPSETTTIHCGRLLNVRTGELVEDAAVVVRDGRIAQVGAAAEVAASGGATIHLRDAICLPGLADLHAHIQLGPDVLAGSNLDRSSADRALYSLRNAQTMLRAGFTTLRDPGELDAHFSTIAVRNSIARGDFVGPRLLIAPHMMSPTGGHGDYNHLAPDLTITVPSKIVDGPDALRQAVREQVKYGADWIKLAVTGGVMSTATEPHLTLYTDEEIRAAVDETHRLGRKITVHAIGAPGIKAAVRAGVDAIEHGILIDDEGIALMKEHGTWLIPTLYVLNYIVAEGPAIGFPAGSIEKALALREERDRRVARAFAAGVRVAYGSDTIFPHQDAAREFAELVRLGLSPIDAIRTATINAAEVLGLEHEIGALEPGLAADIIAVATNPLDDIRVLEDVRFVMKGGTVVRNDWE